MPSLPAQAGDGSENIASEDQGIHGTRKPVNLTLTDRMHYRCVSMCQTTSKYRFPVKQNKTNFWRKLFFHYNNPIHRQYWNINYVIPLNYSAQTNVIKQRSVVDVSFFFQTDPDAFFITEKDAARNTKWLTSDGSTDGRPIKNDLGFSCKETFFTKYKRKPWNCGRSRKLKALEQIPDAHMWSQTASEVVKVTANISSEILFLIELSRFNFEAQLTKHSLKHFATVATDKQLCIPSL